MTDQELEAALAPHLIVEAGRRALSCGEAHRLATELNLPVERLGEFCQTNNIKIVHCQLGCFGGHHK